MTLTQLYRNRGGCFQMLTVSHYSKNTGTCVDNSMVHDRNPEGLLSFTTCITLDFMTEMGARSSCSDESVRPDSDTNDNTITLLSKDYLLYNFMADTLNAGNICQARNDALIFSTDDCDWYISLRKNKKLLKCTESRCTYNTPSNDSDRQVSFKEYLDYRFMKSLSADSVCAVNRMTLAYMCSLFVFLKELLQEGGVSTESTMIDDTDAIVQKKNWMFSDVDCDHYSNNTGTCVDNSMVHETNPKGLLSFTTCITLHFMTEMGARSSCSDESVRPDSDTNDKNIMTVLSKDRLFYTFMEDTLNAGNICQATTGAVKLSTVDCSWYILLRENEPAESRCAYNTPSTHNDRQLSFKECLDYRLMKSLGADSVCTINRHTLAYMCSLFGFMKEWLPDSATICDNDTVVQQGMRFSGRDCEKYHLSTLWSPGECVDNSTVVHFEPEQVIDFTNCITTHFMTEMGARRSCSDDFVRPDNDTNVMKTMTLSSTYQYFYTFMEDTLNAGNICQATTDAVIFSTDDYDWYIRLMKNESAESRCTYNTPSTHSDKQLSFKECIAYHFMKSLCAGGVCRNRVTVAYMCSLFGLMREWLQEVIYVYSHIIVDSDTIVQRKGWMFSDDDCGYYSSHAKHECVNNSMVYETDSDDLSGFIHCMTSHFMTDVGARSSCSDDSVRPDTDTNDKNTATLLSKNHVFLTFMVDTLDAGNICPVIDVPVTVDDDQCDWYIKRIKYHYAERTCAVRTDGREELSFRTYAMCLQYRLMKRLEADTVCQISLFKSCFVYYDIMQSLIPTCICVIGLTGNLLSLWMFCSGAMNIPTAYQLQWLEGVDITFIVTWWIVFVLPDTLHYFNAYSDHYRDWIEPVLYVCFRPLSYVARSCTVWLTVLIGLYHYLAICHPSNNLPIHVTRHGHKYVVLVVILSFLYNIPYFGEYYLHQEGFGRAYNRTGFVSKELLNVIYPSHVHSVIVVGVPCLILIFVTVSILVELRKREKKKRNMQTTQNTQTTQNSVTPMFVTILITFILCQLPYFVWYGFGEVKILSTYDYLDCGSVMFYIRWLINLGLLLNSSANGFIYFFLNKTFRDALFSCCPCRRDDGTETIEMGPVNTRPRPDDTHP